MDKFFDYLIFLFIAYGIFSSYFKQMKQNAEKKKQENKSYEQDNYSETEMATSELPVAEHDAGASLSPQNFEDSEPVKSNENTEYNFDYDTDYNVNYQTDYNIDYDANYNVSYKNAVKQNWVQAKVKEEMKKDEMRDEQYLSQVRAYAENEVEFNTGNLLNNMMSNPHAFKVAFLFSELINPPISLREDA